MKPLRVTPTDATRHNHIFFQFTMDPDRFKCVLCGGVTAKLPPYPYPEDWLPEKTEKLTREERALCPNPNPPPPPPDL